MSFADSPDPISWRAVARGMPVIASDDTFVGRVWEVRGSDEADIFRGFAVRLDETGRDVFVGADDLAEMTTAAVTLRLSSDEIRALQPEDDAGEVGQGVTDADAAQRTTGVAGEPGPGPQRAAADRSWSWQGPLGGRHPQTWEGFILSFLPVLLIFTVLAGSITPEGWLFGLVPLALALLLVVRRRPR